MPTPPSRRFRLGVLSACVAGLVVRLALIFVARPTCPGIGPSAGRACFGVWGDAAYGYWQGRLIGQGHWFKNPVVYFLQDGGFREAAGKPPLYPLFLAAVGRYSGLGTPWWATLAIGLVVLGAVAWVTQRLLSRWTARVLTGAAAATLAAFALVDSSNATSQRVAFAICGVGVVALLGLAGREIAGERAGLLAAALGALNPLLWINDGMLQVESLYAVFVVWAILAAYRWWRDPAPGRLAVLAVVLALGATLRAEAQLLLPFLMVPLALRTLAGWRARLSAIGVAGVIALAIWAPWLVWNQTRFAEAPAFAMTTGSGAVLVSAYCDETFYGEALGYWAAHCFDPGDTTGLDDSEVDAIARRQAVSYARDHLGRLPMVVAARIGRMYDLYRPLDTLRINWQVEGRGRAASTVALAVNWLLMPVAVAGAVVLWRRRVTLVPLAAQVAVVTVTAALSFGVTRYRVPADLCVILLAAVAVDALVRRRTA